MQPTSDDRGDRTRRVLVTNHHLDVRAGSELLTLEVADELMNRGHQVALFTHQPGVLSRDFSATTGIPVYSPLDRGGVRDWEPDVMHVHHWPTLAYLRSTGVDAPAVIGFLGVLPDLENPPPLDADAALPWWAVSEEVVANVRRVRGWEGAPHVIVRNWFDDREAQRQVPVVPELRSILVVSNHFPVGLLNGLREAGRHLGAQVTHVGLPDNARSVDSGLLGEHDAVVSLGRTAVLAMSLGLPVLVLDERGGDGWVTADSLDEVARHNFSGRAHRITPTPELLGQWLATPPTLRDLCAAQDWAWTHCRLTSALDELEKLHVEAIRLDVPPHPSPAWMRVVGDQVQNAAYLGRERRYLAAENEQLLKELTAARTDLVSTRAQLAASDLVRDHQMRLLDGLLDSASWRLTSPLRSMIRTGRQVRDAVGGTVRSDVGQRLHVAYDSPHLALHSAAARVEFRRQERRLPRFAPGPASPRMQLRRSESIPPMSWVGELTEQGWSFTIGAGVEELDNGFFEGVWDGDLLASDPSATEFGFGSGALSRQGRTVFVPPRHPKEALFVIGNTRDGRSWVSNSLAFALLAAGVSLASPFFTKVAATIKEHTERDNIRGIDRQQPLVVSHDGLVLNRIVYHNFEVGRGGTVRRRWSRPRSHISDFSSYRILMLSVMGRLISNGADERRRRPLRPLSTLSRGYDSTAVSALASQLGVEHAVTLAVEVYGRQDSGSQTAALLGLDITEHPHLMTGSIDQLDIDGVPGAWHETAMEFLATTGLGDDVAHTGFESQLDRALLFTGTWGDLIWDPQAKTPSGLSAMHFEASKSEFRLRVGFAWVPAPFIGARFAPPVDKLARSREMAPFTLGTDYDRPIPRRIAEEAGVPRGAFGVAKTATSPFIARHASYFAPAIEAMYGRYSPWRD